MAQRKTIKAIASYNSKGQASHVFSITRQGMYHSYLQLVAGSANQMNMQSPVNAFGEDLATPKKILELAKAVMGKGFNEHDTLCKLLRAKSAFVAECLLCCKSSAC